MDNSIRLLALRLFARVASTGSFAEAARYFDLPASSVSRHIAGLERTLGQRLLYRHTRAVRLTDAGERYYQDIHHVLESLDVATEQVIGGATHPQGVLRINAPVAFGRRHLAPLLARFQDANPAVEVELALSDAFIDPVHEGADVVIRVGALDDSSLVARQLATQCFVACAAPEYLSRHGEPRHPEELKTHNCLVYKGTRGVQPWYFRDSDDAPAKRYPVKGNLHSNNAESLVEAALQGQGIVLFPTWLLFDALRGGGLVPILEHYYPMGEATREGIHAIYPENRLRSQKVATFLAYLVAQIGDPPYWDR
ncbi:LysR family transcriptional regulator [Vreelandella salicampi]|uniref:LysR family transcriptional regulator n=1 Tax=Vreelandella salicampi TaxID=1449798 RepID=A0A7Z0LK54_9GAMM|nr:LysR family transcriptional regulator [Halomonas salicampi]NYS60425.1 LysR family transcriptional regulator [Halomonas salicampi]